MGGVGRRDTPKGRGARILRRTEEEGVIPWKTLEEERVLGKESG